MHAFANPARFLRLADAVLPWSIAITGLSFAAGLSLALIGSPADYQQGEAVRIMYVHVPAAWMCMFTYMFIAAASLASIVWRHPLADIAARAAAPLGMGFTAIALVTGASWGKPMWGAWWVWDARLTSVLVLFFIYLGYEALWQAIGDPVKAARAAAIFALVGAINIPIIKFSVDWWNSLHQPASILRSGGIAIDGAMLKPLLVMFAAYNAWFVTVLLWRIKAGLLARKLDSLRHARALGGDRS